MKGDKSMATVKVNSLKVKTEAQMWQAGGGGSEIQNELTWSKQKMRCLILSRGLDQRISRVSTTVWFSVLFVLQEWKRWIFWTSGLTGRFWAMMFHATYLKWFIPILFASFHHLQWLVKVLLCIYVAFMSWLWHSLGKSLRFVELFPSEAL